jgi:hypothetical protein
MNSLRRSAAGSQRRRVFMGCRVMFPLEIDRCGGWSFRLSVDIAAALEELF